MSSSTSQLEKPDYITKMMLDKRKAKKPIMEKMRRDRINSSLQEMKNLVLEALKKDVSRYSKMEKADMLEMTVKYLRSLKRKERCHTDPSSLAEYRAGFNHCASNLTQELFTSDVPEDLRNTILTHLASTCQTVAAATGNHLSSAIILPPQSHTALLPTRSVATATNVPISTFVRVPNFPSPPPSPSEKIAVHCQYQNIVLPRGKSKSNDVCNLSKSITLPRPNDSRILNNLPSSLVWRPWS